MQEFKKIYPEAVQINLCVNYRCRAPIVAAAKSVIAHNKNRYEKDIVAAQTGYGMQTACVAVSYTHLDVYKRQLLWGWQWAQRLQAGTAWAQNAWSRQKKSSAIPLRFLWELPLHLPSYWLYW